LYSHSRILEIQQAEGAFGQKPIVSKRVFKYGALDNSRSLFDAWQVRENMNNSNSIVASQSRPYLEQLHHNHALISSTFTRTVYLVLVLRQDRSLSTMGEFSPRRQKHVTHALVAVVESCSPFFPGIGLNTNNIINQQLIFSSSPQNACCASRRSS